MEKAVKRTTSVLLLAVIKTTTERESVGFVLSGLPQVELRPVTEYWLSYVRDAKQRATAGERAREMSKRSRPQGS